VVLGSVKKNETSELLAQKKKKKRGRNGSLALFRRKRPINPQNRGGKKIIMGRDSGVRWLKWEWSPGNKEKHPENFRND